MTAVALITGAGSQDAGIGNGRAAAILLARRGYTVVAVDHSPAAAQATVDLIEAEGGTAHPFTADVSDDSACEAAVAFAAGLGDLEVLINNVGIVGPPADVTEISRADWDSVWAVNVTSMMLMSKYAIPHMAARGKGSIVNTTSIAGTISHPRIAYSTTKGAVEAFTRSLASVHGQQGIRVNCAAPGFVYTPMVKEEGVAGAARTERAQLSALKTEGTGWHVGAALVYLAVDAEWITGVTLPVDGGYSAVLHASSSATFSPDE